MAAITTRQTGTTGVDGVTRKNSPLTNTEIDTNFINLNNNKLESSWTGNTSIVTLGTVATGTWNATTISVAKGGTGLTSTPANGALDIGNGSGFTRTTLTGTTNRISVTNGAGSITLSTPQDIATSSNVQFGSLGVGTAASGTAGELRAPLGQITTLIVGTLTFGDSTVQSTAAFQLGAGQTWQNVTASRTTGVAYYNTTGRTIFVAISATVGLSSTTKSSTFLVNGSGYVYQFAQNNSGTDYQSHNYFMPIPAGASYQLNIAGNASFGIDTWSELR